MEPKVYTVSDHDIDPRLVDQDALYVISTLRAAGYEAYLVGGSVRDLLIKKTPKDYDISTSALPEEIKQVFQRRCLLIGRRFRLAHIRFGHKIIEVATFRSGMDESDLILHDNQWGTAEQDVLRRDFTVNGLFYDPKNHTIIDYVGGWEDIHKKVLRIIGNAEVRFKQDPVRMIRLLKFRARFGFNIDPEARKALIQCKSEILKSSPARILEEVLRMLESGAAAPFFNLLAESGMLKYLYPALFDFLKTPCGQQIPYYLASIDKINSSKEKAPPLDRSILTSCLIFPLLEHEVKEQYLNKNQIPHLGEIVMLIGSVIRKFEAGAIPRLPRRITAIMSGLLSNQYRLTPLTNKRQHYHRILKQKDFAEALLFLKIRAFVDKSLIDVYTQWKKLYKQNTHQKTHKPHNPPPPLRHGHIKVKI